jgi:hypothetical protein
MSALGREVLRLLDELPSAMRQAVGQDRFEILGDIARR